MQAKLLIRKALEERNISMTQLVKLLQENGIQTSYSNLHNKLQHDSLKYAEVLEIMHVLDFEVKIQDKMVTSISTTRHKTDESVEKIKRKVTKMITDDQKEYIREIVQEHCTTLIENCCADIKCELSSELGIHLADITKKKPPSRGGY